MAMQSNYYTDDGLQTAKTSLVLLVDGDDNVAQGAGNAHRIEAWADDPVTGTNLWTAEVLSNVVAFYSTAAMTKTLGTAANPWTALYATDATLGSHTATRVFFAGTGGLVSTDAGMTFNSTTNTFALGANHIYSQGAHGQTADPDDWWVGSSTTSHVGWDNSATLFKVYGYSRFGTTTLSNALGDLAAGLTGAAQTWYDQSAATHYWYNASGVVMASIDLSATPHTQFLWTSRGVSIAPNAVGGVVSINRNSTTGGLYSSGHFALSLVANTTNLRYEVYNTAGTLIAGYAVTATGWAQNAGTGGAAFGTPAVTLAAGDFAVGSSSTNRVYWVDASRSLTIDAASGTPQIVLRNNTAGSSASFYWVTSGAGEGYFGYTTNLNIGTTTAAGAAITSRARFMSDGTVRLLVGATFGADAAPTNSATVDIQGSLGVGAHGTTLANADACFGSSSTNKAFWDDNIFTFFVMGCENVGTTTDATEVGAWSAGKTGKGRLFFRTAGGTNGVFLKMYDAAGNVAVSLLAGDSSAGAWVFNESAGDNDFRVEGQSLAYMLFLDASSATENLVLLTTAAPAFNSMDGGIFLGDATTAPTGNPTAGIYVWSEAGAGKARGGGGTVTTWAPSDPHCPRCGGDFGFEWENSMAHAKAWGGRLQLCASCLMEHVDDLETRLDALEGGGKRKLRAQDYHVRKR